MKDEDGRKSFLLWLKSKALRLKLFVFVFCCCSAPSWAHEMMSALMWVWFQKHNTNSSRRKRFMQKHCSLVPLWRGARLKAPKLFLLIALLLFFLKLKTGEKKITFQVKISLVRGDVLWPTARSSGGSGELASDQLQQENDRSPQEPEGTKWRKYYHTTCRDELKSGISHVYLLLCKMEVFLEVKRLSWTRNYARNNLPTVNNDPVWEKRQHWPSEKETWRLAHLSLWPRLLQNAFIMTLMRLIYFFILQMINELTQLLQDRNTLACDFKPFVTKILKKKNHSFFFCFHCVMCHVMCFL